MEDNINGFPPEDKEAQERSEGAADPRFAQGCKYCTRCGRRLPVDAAYCDGCGHMQGAKKERPVFADKKSYCPEKVSDIIGKERSYYNEKFSIISETGGKACFNWYACLGWFWFAYRKMPIEAALCFALYCILGSVPSAGRALQLALLAMCGVFGNYIYMKHIERTIDRIDAMPVQLRQNAVREYGGVSGVLLIIAFLVSGVLICGFGVMETLLTSYARPIWYIKHIF